MQYLAVLLDYLDACCVLAGLTWFIKKQARSFYPALETAQGESGLMEQEKIEKVVYLLLKMPSYLILMSSSLFVL